MEIPKKVIVYYVYSIEISDVLFSLEPTYFFLLNIYPH